MRNLELKARCADLERAETIALSIDAELGGDLHQRDIYYRAPKGRLKLRAQDQRFDNGSTRASSELIYYERPEEGVARWSDYVRVSVAPDASADMHALLRRVLDVRQEVEKQRRLYLYRGARIHLDQVEQLGTFIEFEVPTAADEAAAREIMRELMQAFGLSNADAIAASYGELMEKAPAAEPLQVTIIPAREESIARINDLIVRSKSHWDWPADYLEKALPLHRIDLSYLRDNACFEVLDRNEQLAAFVAVVISGTRIVLDNLWVRPDLIGKGVGRRACEHVFRLAPEHGWTELWVVPDPPAIGFYEKMGFSDTGERLPSRVPSGPVFSVYRLRLEP